ncbi:MAG TPA: TolC family protein, partial [Bacteroidia bacterium]
MKKIQVCFYLFISMHLAFASEYALAQGARNYISLNDAFRMADNNYPLIKAKDLNIKAAQEHFAATKEEVLMPALKLHEQVNYATANSVQGTYFSYGISTSGGIGSIDNYDPVYGSVSLAALEWVPYSFGQNRSKIEISKIELNNATFDADNERFRHQIR